ncbi:MAG: glycerophosphodiester phosphodiesterase [Clostridiales bacterium]
MQEFKYALGLLKTNFKALLIFELLYKLFTITIFTPLLVGLFNLSLKISGLSYLSNKNLPDFLTDPITILFIIVIFIGITFFTLIEMTAIIQCFHGSFYNIKISAREMFSIGYYSAKKFFQKKNWLLIVFVVFIIPITNFTLVSGFISGLAIPEFIMDFIVANALLLSLFTLLMFGLILLAIRWIFSIHYFTLESDNFSQARKDSVKLIKGHYISSVLGLFIWNIAIALLLFLFSVICLGLIILGVKIFCSAHVAYSAALTVASIVLAIITAVGGLFSVPIVFAYISSVFYYRKEQMGENIAPYNVPVPPGKKPLKTKFAIILVVVAVAINGAYIGIATLNHISSNVQLLNHPEITAHRGDSVKAPENTMPAFKSAIKNLADYAELDVHQTKDGVIVVMHDDNLKRISGKDINIWDINYDELQKIDVGSWFDPKFDYVRISTLDEVIKACKGKIKLNIELKPSGNETNYEQMVIDIINDNNFRRDCVVSSLNAPALENVKKIDPDIKTVFLMAVAYGGISQMEFADGFSIESSFITPEMVKNVHAEGKDLYAWTVNNEENMRKIIDLGVDSIVTDNPILAREMIYGDGVNDGVAFIINYFLPKKS